MGYVEGIEVGGRGMIETHQINYLKDLDLRLNRRGFSWQHDDFYKLKTIIPEILCHLCVHGDKNDGACFECFNESKFERETQRRGNPVGLLKGETWSIQTKRYKRQSSG